MRLEPCVLCRQKHSSSPQQFQDIRRLADGTTTGNPFDAVWGGTDHQIYYIVGGGSTIDRLRPPNVLSSVPGGIDLCQRGRDR